MTDAALPRPLTVMARVSVALVVAALVMEACVRLDDAREERESAERERVAAATAVVVAARATAAAQASPVAPRGDGERVAPRALGRAAPSEAAGD